MLRKSAVLIVVLVLFSAVGFGASSRLAIADSEGKAVSIVDVDSGKLVGSVSLADAPDKVFATPDGKRVVAVSRGAGKTTWIGEFRPKVKASATIVDLQSMKAGQRIELGWDATDAQITPNGKTLVILSPGVDAKPPENKSASLYAIDLTSGNVIGSVNFDRPANGAVVTGDQKQAVVYFEGAPRQKRPTVLRFVDLGTMEASGDVSIEAKTVGPAAFEGHDFIYLLDPPLGRAGTLHVVSASQRKLAGSHPVGQQALIGAFDEESGRLYVLSQSTTRGTRGFNGEMYVFRNGAPETVKKMVDYPARMVFTPDRKLALVAGSDLNVIPLDKLEPEPTVKGGPAYEMYVSPDQKRAYLYYWSEQQCCSVGVYDLPTRTLMKSYLIGSKGARFGQALLALAATAGSYSSGRSAAGSSGSSSFYYTVYTPKIRTAGRGMMILRPDGKFAYALDPQTNYVTVIDSESGERLQGIKVGGGSRELVALKDASTIAVIGAKGVTFVDTSANAEGGKHEFTGELRGFESAAGGTRGVALADGKVLVVDGSGKLVGDVTTVKKPADWLFLP